MLRIVVDIIGDSMKLTLIRKSILLDAECLIVSATYDAVVYCWIQFRFDSRLLDLKSNLYVAATIDDVGNIPHQGENAFPAFKDSSALGTTPQERLGASNRIIEGTK